MSDCVECAVLKKTVAELRARVTELERIRANKFPAGICWSDKISMIADVPCSRCGERHVLDEFELGRRVITPHGPGTVDSWTQYSGPLIVWVRLDSTKSKESYDPCQLRLE